MGSVLDAFLFLLLFCVFQVPFRQLVEHSLLHWSSLFENHSLEFHAHAIVLKFWKIKLAELGTSTVPASSSYVMFGLRETRVGNAEGCGKLSTGSPVLMFRLLSHEIQLNSWRRKPAAPAAVVRLSKSSFLAFSIFLRKLRNRCSISSLRKSNLKVFNGQPTWMDWNRRPLFAAPPDHRP